MRGVPHLRARHRVPPPPLWLFASSRVDYKEFSLHGDEQPPPETHGKAGWSVRRGRQGASPAAARTQSPRHPSWMQRQAEGLGRGRCHQ